MPSSVNGKLLFLPPKTPTNHARKSKYRLELEEQEARAHAARVSHQRAGRGGKYVGQKHAALPISTCSRSPLPFVQEDVALRTKRVQRQWNSQGLVWIKTGPLDPFFRLPADLDIKDRNLLYFYLDKTPRLVHGVKENPVYCPVRECTVVSIADSPLFLQWIIFMAEMMTGASKAAIYARRAVIYADTRKVLQNPANFLLDTTLLHLVVASLAETRLGNLELADKHFTGLLQVLKLRNGLRTFQEIGLHLGLGMLHAFVVGQVPLFRRRDELLGALGRMSLPRARKPIPPMIRRFFGTCSSSSAHIGNLHMLNMIMVEEPDGYIDRLVYYITGSGDKLTPMATTFMIGQSAVEVGEWYGPNPLVRSWETIEFVRLLTYATEARDATVMALSSWLTGDGYHEVDVDDLKTNIHDGWVTQNLG